MSDLRQCSREFITEFIDIYRQNICLWCVNSPDYLNKQVRRVAYGKLRNKLLEIDRKASIDVVKKKINSLRSTFRSECKKVENSLRSGSDVYKPTLWYFNLLQFLRDQNTSREMIRSSTAQEWLSGSEVDEEEDTIDEKFPLSPSSPTVPYSPAVSIDIVRPKYRRKYRVFNQDNSEESTSEKLPKKSDGPKRKDDCDIFGKHVACKIRKLSETDQIFTEKIINDALFQAQLGNAKHMKIAFSDDE